MNELSRSLASTLVSCACVLAVAAAPAEPTRAQDAAGATRRVVVVVRSLRSDVGQVVAAVYTSPRGWLDEDSAVDDCRAPIRNGEARCVFEVPAGAQIAFCGMHDEDGDGAFDRDFLGLPQEGYAFSNDAREPFGPPSFQAAAFEPPSSRGFVVHARYGI